MENGKRKVKTKRRSWMQIAVVIAYVISILILLWIGKSLIEVWTGNVEGKGNAIVMMAESTESDCVVTACRMAKGDRYYTVTVEDAKGNQWSYYDDTYMEKGTQLCVSFHGNEVIDANSR